MKKSSTFLTPRYISLIYLLMIWGHSSDHQKRINFCRNTNLINPNSNLRFYPYVKNIRIFTRNMGYRLISRRNCIRNAFQIKLWPFLPIIIFIDKSHFHDLVLQTGFFKYFFKRKVSECMFFVLFKRHFIKKNILGRFKLVVEALLVNLFDSSWWLVISAEIHTGRWSWNETHCAIWYHFYNFKNVERTHGGVILLVIATLLKASLSMGVFYFFKIVQMVPNSAKHHKCWTWLEYHFALQGK